VNAALLAAIVAGIGTGSIYAIAAMGLVLTNKTSGIFNFAHGAQAAAGAYLMWELWKEIGWPWPIAALGSVLLAGIGGGLLMERVAYALADKSLASRVVATIGLLVAIQGVIVLRYGSASIPMQPFLPQSTVRFAGVNIRYEQLIVSALALGTAAGLGLFFARSRQGVAMQGVVDDPALLGLQGVSPIGVRRQAWLIGSCFAAISGVLLAPSLGLDASLLTLLVVQAYGAVAIGRFQSLPLTYVGGIVVGVGQEVVKYLTAQPFLADRVSSQILQPLPSNVPFLVLFVVLLVTPRRKLIERGSRVVRREPPTTALSRNGELTVAVVGGGLLLLAPHLAATKVPLFTTAAAFVFIFASLHLLVRTSGQVSLCHMALAAVGAATFARCSQAGIPFGGCVLLAGLAAVPVGAVIAVPAIRLSGVYLAIATFGFGILVQNLAFPSAWLFGPRLTQDANRPSFASGDDAYYYLVVVLALLACLAVLAVRRSRLGRCLRALADSPAAVAAQGANGNVVRVLVFCISAFIAGIGGALLGPITGSASGVTFSFSVSLILIAVLFIAGRRPVLSAFIAAAAYIVAPSYVHSEDAGTWTQIVFGVAALVVACGVPALLRARWFGSARAGERAAADGGAASAAQARTTVGVPA
jgi:branched-subunit amino acid ABC-type transport system permease component